MYHRVHDSKYRQEVISFIWDFREQLPPGSVIIGQGSGIEVSSGDDPNPTEMFPGPPTVSGTVVTQQIRRGIPGNIYTITMVVEIAGPLFFEAVCYLAILPRLDDIHVTVWETTQLYPLDVVDSMKGVTNLRDSRMNGYPIPPEDMQGYSILTSGHLALQLIRYNIPHEDIQGYSILVSGHMQTTTSTVTYHVSHEDMQGYSIPVSGEMIFQALFYQIPTESIQGYTIPTEGFLG